MATHPKDRRLEKPPWLRIKLPTHENFFTVSAMIRDRNLHTICQSAKCPNISECWTNKTATFLILGDVCTRDCAFCAVSHGTPSPPIEQEAAQVTESVAAMGLLYTVITSVTRDDLLDGGASCFVEVINAVRRGCPETKIEVLIPDFKGDVSALNTVLSAKPDVLNHNLEVPESLYPKINRPRENYRRSLDILRHAKKMGTVTKSGLMLGLGESQQDLHRALLDLREAGCDLLTIGQYLQATKNNLSIVKYYTPEEFEQIKAMALEMGFLEVEAGPLVRSSYRAHKLYQDLNEAKKKTN